MAFGSFGIQNWPKFEAVSHVISCTEKDIKSWKVVAYVFKLYCLSAFFL